MMDLFKETEVLAYLKKAEHDFKAGKYKTALKAYLKVAELNEYLKRDLELADAYQKIAESYQHMKYNLKAEQKMNSEKAVEYYLKAAEKYMGFEEYSQAGECYESASKLSEELDETEKAVSYSSKSLTAYGNSGDLLSTSHAYLNTARYYEKLGRLDSAAENYEKAGEVDVQISDDRQAASNFTSAAECYKKMDKPDKVVNALANSASANLRLREYSKIADTYEEMAEAYMKLNDFDNSVYYNKKAAELRFDNKNYAATGSSYMHIGDLYEKKKEYDKALKYYKDAAKITLEAKNFAQAAAAYGKVGECYEKMGDMPEASEYYVYAAKTNATAGKPDEANKTFRKAGKDFLEQAETKFIEKDYKGAVLCYEKAAECYEGLEDYSRLGEIYVRKAGVHLKAGEEKESRQSYVLAAESYLKAGDFKNAGYNYNIGEEYVKSASAYTKYAESKVEGDDFQAGEGYRLAARVYSRIGADTERRDSYNKAIFHYGRIVKIKPSDTEEEKRLKADASERMGECYLDMSDFHKAENFLQKAVDLYKEVNYPIGGKLASALLDRTKGDLELELANHDEAVKMLKNSVELLDELIGSGKFNADFTDYLKGQREAAKDVIYKIEVKPEIRIVVDEHVYAFTDTPLLVNGILTNDGRYNIRNISFLSHPPEEFEIINLPPDMKELKPKESIRVSTKLTIKKTGEYVFKPFEIFYRDDKNNKYVKSSNEIMISVDERPPEDFKNYRLAVEVYSRYAKTQLSNKNYLYAGDGFKKAAEIYGRFSADDKLKEYYGAAVDAYMQYAKTRFEDEKDLLVVRTIGDAFWNIAESYEATGDLNNAIENYGEALKRYEKSGAEDKIPIGNGFISKIEAKKAIEGGAYAEASKKLSQSIEFLNEALSGGGLSQDQMELIEKHNSEARMLIDKIKGTPVVLLDVKVPKKVYLGKKFSMNVSLTNPGEITLRKIRFISRFPDSFAIEESPTQLFEAEPKSSQNFLFEYTPQKAGEYKFKPLDLFYTDDKNNSYMHGSNQIAMAVLEKEAKPAGLDYEEEFGEKPRVSIVIEEPQQAAKDARMVLKGVIENKSSITVNGIRFLVNAPGEFEVAETPEVIDELKGSTKEKISMQLIPHVEGEYNFRPIEIFYRDVHRNRFFKSSNEITVKVSAGAVIAGVARPPAALETGLTYLLEDEDRDYAVGMLKKQMEGGYAALYLTRVNPEQVEKSYNLVGANLVWLTDIKAGGKYRVMSSTSDVSIAIAEFIKSNKKSFILMEGIEYLIDISGFTETIDFIKFQRDKISTKDSTLLVLVSPKTLDTKQLQRLEHECILYRK